jgi:putative ABC transport system permease protein
MAKTKDFFNLAFGNLRHRGLRSWLTILGIFIGIAAIVALISLGDGLRGAVTGQFASLDADKLIIQSASTGFGPPGSTAVKKLTEHDIKIIEGVPGVSEAVGRLVRVGKIEYNKVAGYGYIASIPQDKAKAEIVWDAANVKVAKGKLLSTTDKGKVVVGSTYAETEDYGKTIRVGSNIKINGKDFEVIGILEKASSFTMNSAILMNEDDMKESLGIGDEWDMIVAQLKDKNQAEQVADAIERKMRDDRNEKEGEEDFSVQTPLQAISSVNTVLDIINIVIAGIAGISLVVGAIGITNTMYTSVLERTREIGIMKAIGAKNSDIMSIFLIESGLLGLVGGIIGVVLGLAMAFGASSAAGAFLGGVDFNIKFSMPLIFGSMGFAFVMGIGAGILPAMQASKLKPVEALRR